MSKVSVIIPAYNCEKFIGRCLRSVLNQNFGRENMEVIVVNDGSIDDTPTILESFRGLVRVIDHQVNRGLPASLNAGIAASSGTYIVRVDADDYVSEDFVRLLVQRLEGYGADAVACDYWLFNDEQQWETIVDSKEEPIGCGILFRKDLMIATGLYDENFLVHEEREFRNRFEERFNIIQLPLPLYRYRRHKDNITNNVELMEKFEEALAKKAGLR